MGYISVPQSTNHSFGSTVNLWFSLNLTLSIINPDECDLWPRDWGRKTHSSSKWSFLLFWKVSLNQMEGEAIVVYSPVVISTFNELTGVVDWRNGCQRWLWFWSTCQAGTLSVKPQHVRNHLWIFVNCLIENPAARHATWIATATSSLAEIHPILGRNKNYLLKLQVILIKYPPGAWRMIFQLVSGQVVELSPSP